MSTHVTGLNSMDGDGAAANAAPAATANMAAITNAPNKNLNLFTVKNLPLIIVFAKSSASPEPIRFCGVEIM
jgi:hypothetical protein